VAHLVWPRFGNVPNYVEPFAGSMAVMLKRPHEARIETVNDIDCYIANFWRATREEPQAVAGWADAPINEADLHARHRWLHKQLTPEFQERMHSDPDYYDVKIAGWWVWGLSAWIGDAWCRTTPQRAMPHISNVGSAGIHGKEFKGKGLWNARPQCGGGASNYGQGVHSKGMSRKRPILGGFADKGVHSPKLHQKRPDIKRGGKGVQSEGICGRRPALQQGGPGHGVHAKGRGVGAHYTRPLYEYFDRLAERLRHVRVCCGQWHRILGPSPTFKIGKTAVFLDPPYGDAKRDKVYNHDSRTLAGDVREYCKENGDNRLLRIALCGYEGEHNELEELGWDKIAWKASGGYGARNPDNKNAARERIWFSPHCVKQKTLFE